MLLHSRRFLEADVSEESNLPRHVLPGRPSEQSVGEIANRGFEIHSIESIQEFAPKPVEMTGLVLSIC